LTVVGDLDLAIGDAGFRFEPLGAGVGGLVKGSVELRILGIDDPRCGLIRGGAGANAKRSARKRKGRICLLDGKLLRKHRFFGAWVSTMDR
jgi:hypothetical protein